MKTNNKKYYLCISKDEAVMPYWEPSFTIGELYEEAPSEWEPAEGTICLYGDEGVALYVDVECFQEYPHCCEEEKQLWNLFWGIIAILAISAVISFAVGLLVRDIF